MSSPAPPLYAVVPVPFTPALLVSTTATEPNPLWVAGTSYAKAAKVVWTHPEGVAVVYHVFESLVSSNSTEPGTDPLKWLDLGPCNKCAMFDSRLSTRTEAPSPLVVVLQPGALCTNLALLNLLGNSVQVEVLLASAVVYSKTTALQSAPISDWLDYFFVPDEQVSVALFDDLPLYASGVQMRITLTGSSTVAVGHCIFGLRRDLGALQLGASAQLVDYSRKETDEFGQTTFVERDFADEFGGQLLVDNGQLGSVKRTLRTLRATPTLFVGTPDPTFAEVFVAFGWVRSHRMVVQYPRHTLMDIEIGALT